MAWYQDASLPKMLVDSLVSLFGFRVGHRTLSDVVVPPVVLFD